jgi:hypothetical protein
MIYLNIILTILCLLLITLLIVFYLFYKNFKSSVGKISHLKNFDALPTEMKEPFKLEDTLEIYNKFMSQMVNKKLKS